MAKYTKVAFLFPGQGAQYPGMGQDFIEQFKASRLVLEEADDILDRHLSKIILHGPDTSLMETKNSQPGLFVTCIAFLKAIQALFPHLKPSVCAGLSLGEYTALTAGHFLSFQECLPLVQQRGILMGEACEATKGVMAVILGLEAAVVQQLVSEANLPQDLWIANFNCPGQVVLSGTLKGIEIGSALAKERGAKRVLPLNVQGAFHSGLMRQAEERLAEYIQRAPLMKGETELVMNVPGGFVTQLEAIRQNLTQQVTHSVCWEQGIRAMQAKDVDLFIEIGPGTTLTGMNKKIGVTAPTLNIEKIKDLETLANYI